MRPVQLVANITDTVEFRTSEGQSVIRQLGRELGGGDLVYLGANIIVLSDGNHWNVLSKPR